MERAAALMVAIEDKDWPKADELRKEYMERKDGFGVVQRHRHRWG